MIDFGTTPQEFHKTLLEKKPFLRKTAHAERPYSWAAIDELVNQIEPVEPFFQLFADGPVPTDAYTQEVVVSGLRRRKLAKERFSRLISGGATLVINRLEVFSLAAQRLCTEVEKFAGYQTTANGYITFGGQGTFGRHWDVHDVFALQLIGSKRWKVFSPTFPYPLSMHTTNQVRHQCPSTPELDCVLEAGDLLYIPRGWWHEATRLDGPSFHLSVGLFVPTIIDYMMWVCGRFMTQDRTARKGLLGSESMDDVASAMRSAQAAALNPACMAEFAKMIADQRRPVIEGDGRLFSSLAGETGAASCAADHP